VELPEYSISVSDNSFFTRKMVALKPCFAEGALSCSWGDRLRLTSSLFTFSETTDPPLLSEKTRNNQKNSVEARTSALRKVDRKGFSSYHISLESTEGAQKKMIGMASGNFLIYMDFEKTYRPPPDLAKI
jgi:hypothetical protein